MRKAGNICVILGTALLVAALALFLMNSREDAAAGKAAVDVIPQLVDQIQIQTADEETEELDFTIPEWELPEYFRPENTQVPEMTELEVDGNGYIGFLSFPTLELELPVMGFWSYDKLKIAPCRYAGNLHSDNLVIMAHNYQSHFGRLNEMSVGDTVLFADVDGRITEFVMAGKDILEATAIEEMTSGAYDLTLFTCTYGGTSRVTVYFDKVED